MRIFPSLLVLLFAWGGAHAQIKCWTGADGKRVCGDTPPPGAKTTTIRAPAAPPAPAAAAKDAKDAKDAKGAKDARKGPLTPAEQEQEYRKRQEEAKKAAEKADQERQEVALKRENCERARESLRTLESGERIARTDAKGERVYLEDAQIQQEIGKARQEVRKWCG
jgi:hypothetical protein